MSTTLAIIRRTVYIVLGCAIISAGLWFWLGNSANTFEGGFENGQGEMLTDGFRPSLPEGFGEGMGEHRGGGMGRGGDHEGGSGFGEVIKALIISLAITTIFIVGDFATKLFKKRKQQSTV